MELFMLMVLQPTVWPILPCKLLRQLPHRNLVRGRGAGPSVCQILLFLRLLQFLRFIHFLWFLQFLQLLRHLKRITMLFSRHLLQPLHRNLARGRGDGPSVCKMLLSCQLLQLLKQIVHLSFRHFLHPLCMNLV
uniref:Uncharacterized protein n=1 Tax=Arundo donax TaxID=35708 RepID=A0A0A9DJ38_ARUDO